MRTRFRILLSSVLAVVMCLGGVPAATGAEPDPPPRAIVSPEEVSSSSTSVTSGEDLASTDAAAAKPAEKPAAAAAQGGAAEYLYDAAGRLAAVVSAETGEVAEYSYDAAGNITQVDRRSAAELSVVSLVPRSAAPGDTVRVYGTGFSTDGVEVAVGGTAVQVTDVTPTSASFVAPDTATSGPVTVTDGAQSAQGPELAVVGDEVTLAQVSPESGMPGSEVVLTGSGFDADVVDNVVTFNGQVAEIVEATPTSLRVVVPTRAGSGPLRVRTPYGAVGWGQDFVVPLSGVDPATVESVRRAEVDGESVNIPVTTAGNVAIVLFDAPAGRQVGIGLTGPTFSGQTAYQVIAPDGEVLANATTSGQSSAQAKNLVAGRTHALLITPASGSTGQVTVTVSTPLHGTATVTGAATALAIDRPGQTARVDLALEEGQNLTLALTGATLGWRRVELLDPDGLIVASDYNSGSSAVVNVGAVGSSGTYAVVVRPDGPTTGSVSVTASLRADAGPVSLTGGATSFVAQRAGQESAGTIDLVEGDILTLAMSGSTLGWRWVELFAPDGTRVDYDYSSGSAVMNVGAVGSSGTYAVVVRPDGPTTGSVSVTASLRADAGPVSLTGGATSFVAQRAGQESAGTIDLVEGDILTLAMSGSTLGWRWVELFAPDGTRVDYDYSSGSAVMNVGAVGSSGTYAVVVRPDGPTTGSVNVTASLRSEAGELVMDGDTTAFVVQRAGQEVAASLDLVEGQGVVLAWTVQSLGARYVEVFDPQGDRLSSRYSFSSPDSLSVTAVPTTGTYTVVVRPTTTATGSVQMTASSEVEAAAFRTAMRTERAKASAEDSNERQESSDPVPRDRREQPGGLLPQWRPDKSNLAGADWFTRRAEVDVPQDLQATAGTTAVAGHVLGLDGTPLAGVTVSAGDTRAKSDKKGRFLLKDVSPATSMIVVDGFSASTSDAVYGIFRIHVDVTTGKTTPLPASVWMPRLDTEHAVELETPTTAETVLTTPFIPGLEVRLPAGTVVRDADGELVDELGITPIPVDRPPFPLPENGIVPTYFTVQPGGTFVFPEGAQIVYPNYTGLAPGTRVDFWNYDPEDEGWYVYGHGTVSEDAQQVVPDEDTRVWSFDGAMFNVPSSEKPGQSRFSDFIDWLSGDPVDLSTGLLTDTRTDLAVDDGIAPISVERSYWQGDQASREFGRGQQLSYGMFLYSEDEYQEVDLYLPGGAKVHYDRTSDGTGYFDAAFRAGPTTGPFRDSTITWIIDGWSLKTRDGLTYWFPDWSRGSSITDRNGNTVTLTRDGASGGGPGQDLTQITSPSGRWIKLAYDNAHRITQARDNIGRTVSYTYDAGGRLSTVTNPAGDMTQYAYDTAGRITSITDARGIAYLTNEYDTNGRVARQTLTDGQVFEFEYVLSSEGRVSEAHVTQPDGLMRRVTFNVDGVATSDTTAAGPGVERTTSFTRRADNLVTAVTDPYGRVSELDYDEQGRLVSTTVLAGTEDEATLGTTVYGRFDLPVEQTDPEGNTTRMRYDNRGNLIETIDPEGRSRTATYTDTGQLASVSDAAGNTTEFSYVSGDLVAMTGPTGEKTRLFTDAAGRRTATRTPSGARREVAYDVLNQPVRVTDPMGNVEQYDYDANGNVTSFTDSAGGVTHWTYDDSDRLVQRTDALGASESRTYDTAGRLASASSRAGRTTTYQYDAFSRLVTAEHSLGGSANSTVTYDYDALDRPTQVIDSSAGTTTITYDARDQVAEVAEPVGTSTYDYDANGRVVSTTAAGQPAREYAYDATGLLAGVAQGGVSVELAHDTAGRLSQVSLPGGWTQSYAYDANNLVSDLTYEHDGQVQGDLTYTYLPDGQPGSVTGSYARVALPEARSGMEYDAQNRLVTSGGAGIDYDADGNMLDDGTRAYEWDELGRLTSVTTGTTSTGFGYSPTGERSSRDDGADRTEFLDVGPNPAVEFDANGQVNAELLSGGMDQWFSRTHAGGTDAVLTDLLGSPVALGSADGTLAAEYAYDPFGATTVTGDAHGADLGFTGRQDDGTGLNYHRARYYNPELGRFISEDPIGFAGGSNLYTYAANAPTAYTDPTGNNPLLVGCIVGAGVDGGISYLTQRLSGRKVQWGQVGAAAAQGCALGMLGPLAGQILRTGRIGANAARAANDIPTIWPTNNPNGFAGQLGTHGNPGVTVLRPGTLVDRFGFDTGGRFVAPNGTPIGQRALAPGTTGKPYSVFEVTNRLVVQHGPAEPWFGQPGLGTQYFLPASVEDLLNAGYLRLVS